MANDYGMRLIAEVDRRLLEYRTAPRDEKPFTAYAQQNELLGDISKLRDCLRSALALLEAIPDGPSGDFQAAMSAVPPWTWRQCYEEALQVILKQSHEIERLETAQHAGGNE